MTPDEVRESFLDFFRQKGHTVVPSDSLVPGNDPTVLFTGAGMNQFKEQFLGRNISFARAASSQKCLRTGDIDNVGKTAAHHTFFEMLGNFSFGDYFKREAITWAWEYLTEVLDLPAERLSVSVYEDDDEAYAIWHDEVHIVPERIYRFDEKENFWPASAPSKGPDGPCGPCSEIFYDQGGEVGCGRPECDPSCDCDRYVEVWNLVFTQFERRPGGVLAPLPSRNIDTGMGLERLCAVLDGEITNFHTELFMPIIRELETAVDEKYVYRTEDGARMRRIVDFVRAAVFCICDGVLPSNEGRGYVLRRLLRRAVGDGVRLGATAAFLHKLVGAVSEVMRGPYPELTDRREFVAGVVKAEEERFHQTLDAGERVLADMMEELKGRSEKVLSGEDAFRLYDTYGFPVDMTRDTLAAGGCRLDDDGFQEAMNEQRERARSKSAIVGDIFATGPLSRIKDDVARTEFVGRDANSAAAKVTALIAGDGIVTELAEGEKGCVILDRSPFYGEAGGQVGDTGVIAGDGMKFDVERTGLDDGYHLHFGVVRNGAVRRGDAVVAHINIDRRLDTAANHTATHLLHHALRTVLGEHARQKGSFVASDRLRFDFTHFSPVSANQLEEIERIVNERIFEDVPVGAIETTLEEARSRGAMALFGEKYGDNVRMVEIGDFSRELCGGTHVGNTGRICLFKIISEESVAAGVRRIAAVTRNAALEEFQRIESSARVVALALAAPTDAIGERVTGIVREVRDLKKEIARLKKSKAAGGVDEILSAAVVIGSVRLVAKDFQDADAGELRHNADQILARAPEAVCVLTAGGKKNVRMVVACGEGAQAAGFKAGALAKKLAPIIGGGGGGRDRIAQAGGTRPEKLDEMFAAAGSLIAEAAEAGGEAAD